ncbi:DUF2267 domain-containing protein [Allostreptomyces psammosilenae]|uniref:Uncharacterized protein (DUF2267 family) n=1 Tax=Allostreptomyces psammosilenae TaxID=1892865 RepID=A0A853ACF1_9ACTN|nr:DUF2267 domain-containing protein [Allostreptomyces psammosilenae]NYI08042.1 uncharacterized protein (DUF2267 family) [Allostreptomyces psammosilenae]
MRYDEFISVVARRADVSREQAKVLTDATLRTLAERLSGDEAMDLAAQLPSELEAPLTVPDPLAERFGLDEFLARVGDRAGVDREQARTAARAVLAVIHESVAEGEFAHVVAQLPREYAPVIT